jgi:hypothetical protein
MPTHLKKMYALKRSNSELAVVAYLAKSLEAMAG